MSRRPADIAIVGMSAILPGAPDLRRFWENVLDAVPAIEAVPDTRWPADRYYDPDPAAPDKIASKWGGFLPDVPFDPTRYGIPPATVAAIDPAQILGLIAAEAALADAGLLAMAEDLRRRTAVILGFTGGLGDLGIQYAARAELGRALPGPAPKETLEVLPDWTSDSFSGLLPNVIAGRIANRFDFGGSSFVVDAACASSLLAVRQAVMELESGRCDVALCGAVETGQGPFAFMCFSKAQALSPTGTCRAFDAAANGTAISEGVGMLVLRRLADARAEGARIYAVIKGVDGSSDGRGRSMMAPLPEGQTRALRRAYAQAGYSAAEVDLFEAHGTGTVAGDAAEVESLSTLLAEAGARPRGAALGSVKPLIGHAKGAAGLAGLMKVALGLHHRVLPPHSGVSAPNAALRAADCPLALHQRPLPWLAPARPRRAGVSAFGFGGANYHVTLEEYRRLSRRRSRRHHPARAGRGAPRPLAGGTLRLARGRSRGVDRKGHGRGGTARRPVRDARRPVARHDPRPRDRPGDPGPGRDLARPAARPVAAKPRDPRRPLDQTAPAAGRLFQRHAIVARRQGRAALSRTRLAISGHGPRTGPAIPRRRRHPRRGGHGGGGAADLSRRRRRAAEPAHLSARAVRRGRGDRGGESAGGDRCGATRPRRPGGRAARPHPPAGDHRVHGCRPQLRGICRAACRRRARPRRPDPHLGSARPRDRHGGGGRRPRHHGGGFGRTPGGARGSRGTGRGGAGPRQHQRRRSDRDLRRAGHGGAGHRLVHRTRNRRPPDPRLGGLPLAADAGGAAPTRRRLRVLDLVGAARAGVLEHHRRGPCGRAGRHPRLARPPSDRAGGFRAHDQEHVHVGGAGLPRSRAEIGADLADPPHPAQPAAQRRGARWRGRRHRRPAARPRRAAGARRPAGPVDPARRPQHRRRARDARCGPSLAGQRDPRPPPAGPAVDGRAPHPTARQPAARRPGAGPRPGGPTSDQGAPHAWVQRARALRGIRRTGGRRRRADARRTLPDDAAVPADAGAHHDGLPDRRAGTGRRRTPRAPLLDAPPGGASAPRPAPSRSGGAGTGRTDDSRNGGRAATPPPAPPQLPTAPAAEPVEAQTLLLRIASERTGYPEDMLGLDLNMEADLGIDSIKRVEILAAFRKSFPPDVSDLLQPRMSKIAKSSSLREILTGVDAALAEIKGAVRPFDHDGGETAAALARYILRPVAEDLPAGVEAPLPRGLYILLPDSLGVADRLIPALTAEGATVRAVPDALLQDPDGLAAWVGTLRSEAKIAGLLALNSLGRAAPDTLADWRAALEACVKALFPLLRAAAPDLEHGGRVLVASGMGGLFGRGGTARPTAFAGAGGGVGLIKCLAMEWPDCRCKAVDLDPDAPADQLAAQVLAELKTNRGRRETGYPGGRRTIFRTEPAPLDRRATPLATPDADWVVLAIGGARGITAETARPFAAAGATLVLAGRSALPGPEDAALRPLADAPALRAHFLRAAAATGQRPTPAQIEARIAAVLRDREIRANLADFQSLGARIDDRICDMRAPDDVAALVADLTARYGRIDAVLYGAGIIEDRLIVDKTYDSLCRVFDTKVDGAFTLARALDPESLKFFALFTSVAGRYGNRGQTDYGAANEVLNRYAWQLQAMFGPRTKVTAVNWGAWARTTNGPGMLTPETARQFRERGLKLIEPDEGRDVLIDELRHGPRDQVEIVAGEHAWDEMEDHADGGNPLFAAAGA